jgi:hypothetical protein
VTPRHLLLNLGDLRKASPDELEALRLYMKRRGWRRYYDRNRRTYRLLCEGMRPFQAGAVPKVGFFEMVRIAQQLGYKLTIVFVEDKSRNICPPQMTRKLAEKRAGGDSTVSSFNGTAFLSSHKK